MSLVKPRAFGEPIHEDAPGFNPTVHRDLVTEVNEAIDGTLVAVTNLLGGTLTKTGQSPAVDMLVPRSPAVDPGASQDFGWNMYTKMTPLSTIKLSGLRCLNAQGVEWRAVVFRVSDKARLAEGSKVGGAVGSESRFGEPVELLQGVEYMVGILGTFQNVSQSGTAEFSYDGFIVDGSTYYWTDYAAVYPNRSLGGYSMPFGLLLASDVVGVSVAGLPAGYATVPAQETRLPPTGALGSVVDEGGRAVASAYWHNGDTWTYTPPAPVTLEPRPVYDNSTLNALKTRVDAAEAGALDRVVVNMTSTLSVYLEAPVTFASMVPEDIAVLSLALPPSPVERRWALDFSAHFTRSHNLRWGANVVGQVPASRTIMVFGVFDAESGIWSVSGAPTVITQPGDNAPCEVTLRTSPQASLAGGSFLDATLVATRIDRPDHETLSADTVRTTGGGTVQAELDALKAQLLAPSGAPAELVWFLGGA